MAQLDVYVIDCSVPALRPITATSVLESRAIAIGFAHPKSLPQSRTSPVTLAAEPFEPAKSDVELPPTIAIVEGHVDASAPPSLVLASFAFASSVLFASTGASTLPSIALASSPPSNVGPYVFGEELHATKTEERRSQVRTERS